MSGLGIMVLTLLLLVSMATSHQDGGGKQATQRDAINVRRRRSITRREVVTEECEEYCKEQNKTCCGLTNGRPRCVGVCFG
uniref:Conotoxin VnMSGL-0123 n=1 Tax=Conus ventricosus TaxID=117992 RepID=O3622_CONVE|nr:RecName: Full=Conotoxin VnMSGL-0123; Flags: Precursor [Conus ventricosus]AAG60507.1 conotoxin scaffold VI/VII precursor [Conus ventricosus]